jgi:hypothetical protein
VGHQLVHNARLQEKLSLCFIQIYCVRNNATFILSTVNMRYRLGFLASLAVACAMPTWALAQTYFEAGAAARDSVLLKARSIRLALDQQTTTSAVRTPRSGVRRIVTRCYGTPPGKPLNAAVAATSGKQLLWKRISRVRRSGATVEKLRAYSDRLLVLKETRINGQVRYLEVSWYGFQRYRSLPVRYQGVLTNTGYVRWRDNHYILPLGQTTYDGL